MENLAKQLADERDRISRRYHSMCLKKKQKKLVDERLDQLRKEFADERQASEHLKKELEERT